MAHRLHDAAAGGAAIPLNVYADSSVLLRIVLGEPNPLPSWAEVDRLVSSELSRLECLRVVDRARIRLGLPDADIAERRADVLRLLEDVDLIAISGAILARAAEPFPTLLGTLDAIHLASALQARSAIDMLAFATHDRALALAAHAVGFSVEGVTG